MEKNQVWQNILHVRSRQNIANEAFFWLRRCELEVVKADILGDQAGSKKALEIGAGIPIQAVLLSQDLDTIYTLDLLQPTTIFSENISKIKNFLIEADIRNVIPIIGNAEKIALKNSSVDLIYSFCALEHIMNLDSCIDEMYRVLKPNGACIHVVPSSMSAIVNFVRHYLQLPLKIIKVIKNDKLSDWTQVRNYLLPEPHGGHFRSFAEELQKSSASQWVGLFIKKGFNYIKTTSSRYLFCEIFPTLVMNTWVFKKTLPMVKSLGHKKPFRYMGTHLCLIFKK